MKKIVLAEFILIVIFFTANVHPAVKALSGDLPSAGNFKVAYYAFDSGGPDHFPLTTFSDKANVVVLFEGKLWELVDSVHYRTDWMTKTNRNYHYYNEILRDVRILQARGVKVLMNVDDAASWSTSTPFTTYDSIKYDYKQFAKFIKACAIDSLHLDGISLDIEHKATGNDQYISLIKELGKYFGPLSSNSTSQIYTAAIYSGGVPGYVIGKSPDVAACFNFVMDMGYWQDYVKRFNQWADYIGASKTMVGVLNDYYNLNTAIAAASWQPANPPKAGIMVYAANNLKSYTDAVFSALTVDSAVDETQRPPEQFVLMQNYPNPFNPSTQIKFKIGKTENITVKIFDMLGNQVKLLTDGSRSPGYYKLMWDGRNESGEKLPSGVYFCTLKTETFTETKKMMMLR